MLEENNLDSYIKINDFYYSLMPTIDAYGSLVAEVNFFESEGALLEFKTKNLTVFSKNLYKQYRIKSLDLLRKNPSFNTEEIRFTLAKVITVKNPAESLSLLKEFSLSEQKEKEIIKLAVEIGQGNLSESVSQFNKEVLLEVSKEIAKKNGFISAAFIISTWEKLSSEELFDVAAIAMTNNPITTLQFIDSYNLTPLQKELLLKRQPEGNL